MNGVNKPTVLAADGKTKLIAEHTLQCSNKNKHGIHYWDNKNKKLAPVGTYVCGGK